MIYDTADRGISVFVTTHYMDEGECCNRVSIMVDGRIEALDSPKNLKQRYNAQSMDEVFHRLASHTSDLTAQLCALAVFAVFLIFGRYSVTGKRIDYPLGIHNSTLVPKA